MTPFIEAATIAHYGLTSAGVAFVVWKVIRIYRNRMYVQYDYKEELKR